MAEGESKGEPNGSAVLGTRPQPEKNDVTISPEPAGPGASTTKGEILPHKGAEATHGRQKEPLKPKSTSPGEAPPPPSYQDIMGGTSSGEESTGGITTRGPARIGGGRTTHGR